MAAADLLLLHHSNTGMAGRPVHVNTAVNALHHAFGTALSSRTRLLNLLQAVAWVGDFIQVHLGGKSPGGNKPTDLNGARLPGSAAEAVNEVFAQLPPHLYTYDPKTRKGSGHDLVNLAARAEPIRQVYALVTKEPDAVALYLQAARSWLAVKATVDAHEYKLPVALFEDWERVSPEWRPRVLAVSARWLHGKQSADSPLIRQAREALQRGA